MLDKFLDYQKCLKCLSFLFLLMLQGDSGGPLVCYFPGVTKFYQIGITSAGAGCGRPRFPGIYTSTARYRHWIDSHLFNKTIIVTIQLFLLFLTVGCITLHIVLWTVKISLYCTVMILDCFLNLCFPYKLLCSVKFIKLDADNISWTEAS